MPYKPFEVAPRFLAYGIVVGIVLVMVGVVLIIRARRKLLTVNAHSFSYCLRRGDLEGAVVHILWFSFNG